MSDKKTVVVHNRSQRAIRTSKGLLPIGGSLEVDESEAAALMDYHGVVDAAKLVPQAALSVEKLRSRVQLLESDVENLRAENAQLKAEIEASKNAKTVEEESEPEIRFKKGKR